MKQYSSKESSVFDQSTYWGRFKHFQMINNPMNMFYSDAKCKEYVSILDAFEKDPVTIGKQYNNEQLWRMKYVVDSNIHPQLKEPINILFRTSSFVPTNIPLCFMLSILPPTPLNQLIAQSTNQTYNFMFNYCNRNASNTFTNQMLGISYFGAVSSAIVGSLGTSWLFKKMNAPSILIRACPLFGVLIANTFNLFFARYPDFSKGIAVVDSETGEQLVGNSQSAARIAFFKTLATRYILPLPIFIPPIIIYLLKQKNRYPSTKGKALAVDLTLAAFCLYLGLSFGIALFPQYVTANANQLEPQFQNQRNSKGNLINSVVFNKGL